MSKEKSPIEVLFEGLDKGLLSDEAKTKLSTLINETVEARVTAKEKLLTEEVEALKKKLTEESEAAKKEAEDLKKKLTEEAEANEKVLVEQAEKYKNELDQAVLEETVKYKQHVEKQRDDEIAKIRSELEAAVLEEAKEFKKTQDAALVEEVKNFKVGLVDKISDYLEAKVVESIPAEIMESAAELAVIKPLVNGINEVYSKNFVKLDTTSFKLIKEAKDEIARLEALVQEKSKEEIKLKKEKREVERNIMIKSLTEGLTQAQKEKAVKLLEAVEVENLEAHFAKIRDIVIESPKAVEPSKDAKTVDLKESAKPVVAKEAAPATPVADKAVINHQVSKTIDLLKESDSKSKASDRKINDDANPSIKAWANKVVPSYKKDDKTK